jgi:hypothetical protein
MPRTSQMPFICQQKRLKRVSYSKLFRDSCTLLIVSNVIHQWWLNALQVIKIYKKYKRGKNFGASSHHYPSGYLGVEVSTRCKHKTRKLTTISPRKMWPMCTSTLQCDRVRHGCCSLACCCQWADHASVHHLNYLTFVWSDVRNSHHRQHKVN